MHALDSETSSLAQEHEKTRAELAATRAELERLAYVAGHDLHAPLRRIKTFCSLLEEEREVLSDDGRLFIEHMRDETTRLGRKLDGLLEYSRAGRFVEPTHCNTLHLLEWVLEERRVLLADVTVELGDLPDVAADRVQVRQVLGHLIDNAAAHRREEPLTISVSGRLGPAGRALFEVADNGRGIPKDDQERVFGLFERLVARDDMTDRAGVGLSVCRKIVSRNGGGISIRSRVGVGTTVFFDLPQAGGVAESATPQMMRLSSDRDGARAEAR